MILGCFILGLTIWVGIWTYLEVRWDWPLKNNSSKEESWQ